MAQEHNVNLFNKPQMEGFLEKVSTGITSKFLAGKTKVWCELYGANLFIFKDNKKLGPAKSKHRASGGASQMDLKTVQMVRKATNDKTGQSFEISSPNRSQVFCASSAKECSTWIQHLQRAMTLKDHDAIPPTVHEENVIKIGDYEDIVPGGLVNTAKPETSPHTSNHSATPSITSASSEYAEVEYKKDSPVSLPSKQPEAEDNDDYSEIAVQARGSYEEPKVVLRSSVAAESTGPRSPVTPTQKPPPVSPRTVLSTSAPKSPPHKSADQTAPTSPTRKAPPRPTFTAPPPPTTSPPPEACEPVGDYDGYSCVGEHAVNSASEQMSGTDSGSAKPVPGRKAPPRPNFTAPAPPSSSTAATSSDTGDDYGYASYEYGGYDYMRGDANVQNPSSEQGKMPLAPTSSGSSVTSNTEKDSFGYTQVGPRTTVCQPVSPPRVITLDDNDDGDDDDEADDEFYTDLMSEGSEPEPIPTLPHPLTEDDEQPLADLQEFLSNNRRICRLSFRDCKVAGDPIGDMKKLLQNLQHTYRKM